MILTERMQKHIERQVFSLSVSVKKLNPSIQNGEETIDVYLDFIIFCFIALFCDTYKDVFMVIFLVFFDYFLAVLGFWNSS